MFKIFRICWKKKYFVQFRAEEITLLKLRSLLFGMSSTNSSELTWMTWCLSWDLTCIVGYIWTRYRKKGSNWNGPWPRQTWELIYWLRKSMTTIVSWRDQLKKNWCEFSSYIQQHLSKNSVLLISKDQWPYFSFFSMTRSLEKKHRERSNALEQELMNERELLSHQCLHLSQKLEKEHLKWQENECRSKETIARLEQVPSSYSFPSSSFSSFPSFPLFFFFFQLFFFLLFPLYCYNTWVGKEQNRLWSEMLDRKVLSVGDKELRTIEESRWKFVDEGTSKNWCTCTIFYLIFSLFPSSHFCITAGDEKWAVSGLGTGSWKGKESK